MESLAVQTGGIRVGKPLSSTPVVIKERDGLLLMGGDTIKREKGRKRRGKRKMRKRGRRNEPATKFFLSTQYPDRK